MDEIGYVFSPLDLKILILFLLSRLPDEIESEQLLQLCQEDGVVNYFDFTICLDELRESGQITVDNDRCQITVRGRTTAETLASSLPYSVRVHAERAVEAEAAEMKRRKSILAQHRIENGTCLVELGLNDGISDVMHLQILCADEEQAKQIEKKFRRSAEDTYQKMIALLCE